MDHTYTYPAQRRRRCRRR